MGDVGAVAELATAIFKWVTDPNGFHELTLKEKCDRLHTAAMKAIDDNDFASFDLLLAEFRRLRAQTV